MLGVRRRGWWRRVVKHVREIWREGRGGRWREGGRVEKNRSGKAEDKRGVPPPKWSVGGLTRRASEVVFMTVRMLLTIAFSFVLYVFSTQPCP